MKRIKLVTLYLFITLIVGCGGGGGGGATASNSSNGDTSIIIVDPYIKDATVFWDINGNGSYDSVDGEPLSTKSDENGNAIFEDIILQEGASLIMYDKGTHNGITYEGTLRANYNTNGIISALTILETKGFTDTEIFNIFTANGITLSTNDLISDPMKNLTNTKTIVTDAEINNIRVNIALNTFFSIIGFDATKASINSNITILNDLLELNKLLISTTSIATSNAEDIINATVLISNYLSANSITTTVNQDELDEFINNSPNNKRTDTLDTILSRFSDGDESPQIKLSYDNDSVKVETGITVDGGFSKNYLNGKTFYSVIFDGAWDYSKDIFTDKLVSHSETFNGSYDEGYSILNKKLGMFSINWKIESISDDFIAISSNDNINYGYLYFDESKAKTYFSTKTNIKVDTSFPVFTTSETISINENTTGITTVNATDTNSITYKITGGVDESAVNIDLNSGVLTLKQAADYETKTSYTFIIGAFDGTNTTSQTIIVNILNVNEVDNTPPSFTTTSAISINENRTEITTVNATDDNSVTYEIINGGDSSLVSINLNSGVLTLNQAADYETKTFYSFVVRADDGTNTADLNITITILNLDEIAPLINSTTPIKNDVLVTSNSKIIVNFNEAMNVNTINVANITLSKLANKSPLVVESLQDIQISYNNMNVTITPNTALTDSYYKLSISDAVKDISNNSLLAFEMIFLVGNTFTHDNIEYKIIESTQTNKLWLNKNLGATQVCTSSTDSDCYGDYYQWGRLTDGHEKLNTTFTANKSPIYSGLNSEFITDSVDWVNIDVDNSGIERKKQWMDSSGEGVCPKGFRVPSVNEITADATILNLPMSGNRKYDGILYSGTFVIVWTNELNIAYYPTTTTTSTQAALSYGMPIRCIVDK